ncbi:uncharacterized protein LOC131010599 [Salvia miltiorrhiza]|uniref:uncharacterized protein LOC131010599 n=1 Tax=Salvia miltiorrhiza TaxID=226208 RepID=UPI0025AB84EC|nr:uncharacterized protein LOC131010599 [Salvia miltiorrhiza]
MGFRNLDWFNCALVAKWLWRYLQGGEELWIRVVRSIYGDVEWGENGLMCKGGRGEGGGRKFLQSGEVWPGGGSLKISRVRWGMVGIRSSGLIESGRWENGRWLWELKWRRELFEWEKGLLDDLISVISDGAPRAGMSDEWKWKATKSAKFTTNSAYHVIAASRGDSHSNQLPHEVLAKVWDAPTPHKVKVTAWRCLRNRLATCCNLSKRHVFLPVKEAWCNSCILREESNDHLFLSCGKSELIWDALQKWIGISTVRPKGVAQHFLMFSHLGQGKRSLKILKALWMCIVWLIWKKRNESRFDGNVWEAKNLVLEAKGRLWSWIKSYKLFVVDCSFETWYFWYQSLA